VRMQNRPMHRALPELPPLDTLVAFDAAARHLSFTRAGDEIALTQSAVSRQIQALEERLGFALFRRLHRALALTDAGQAFHRATAEALAGLERAVREGRRQDALKTVVVTTTPGFAGLWLIPRLSSFVSAHPGVDVRISAGNGLSRLDHDGVDLAVRYQPVDSPGGVRLFGETVFPVCAPRLRRDAGASLATPADLGRQTLLRMEPHGTSPLQDWGLWLHAHGLGDLQPAGVLHFSSYDQLIQAALAGQGVALGRSPLIDRLLAQRKLVAPFADRVASPRNYVVIVAAGAAGRPEVAHFAAWLTAEARAPDSTRPSGRARA